ncbi:uncharacterized protein LOC127788494 isoform X3 [Diospyros lotus]|uniref:uncharacterized protein LOC127788494 isoform X3 n=1 Tax=Diospyros lotus TaxID=55363 RepID=UPI002251C2F8|nr:uncharacterized protein LOC127788494 isoform X3 [Diospyros lotus]
MELLHFSHDHPLILTQEHHDGGLKVLCNGCRRPISGPSYSCRKCSFFLHKWCSEFPREMTHPSHPKHPLSLFLNPPTSHWTTRCELCESLCNAFIYRCSNCDFNLDLPCASITLRIRRMVEHESHAHQLIPIHKPTRFLCDACGRTHEGESYLCTTCGFWVNQDCASVPTSINLRRHRHPLTLIYSIPYKYGAYCEICSEELNRVFWVYCCSECQYFVHVDCVPLESGNSKKDSETDSDEELDPNSADLESPKPTLEMPKDSKEEINPITFPVPDESPDVISQLIKNIRLHGRYTEAGKISHCSEDHPLIFLSKQIDEAKDDQVCNGCGQTISSPFYHCIQCNFSLHEWCADLPNELQHISHPEHPLLLITYHSHDLHLHKCGCCGLFSNGFVFGCSACRFYLDVKCASLPRVIKHQAHDHTLALRRARSEGCDTCEASLIDIVSDYAFVCEACHFKLCIGCALLPFTIGHRYDKHPFALTYDPIKGQPDEYYCAICEDDIDSMCWFYHCVDCDQSLHPTCIYPIERYLNVKFGGRFKVDDHCHLLSCVHKPKGKDETPCSRCGKPFPNSSYIAFECESCDFWIHHVCNPSLQNEEFY